MIGQRIAHYEILEELGKGGMATVYRVYDPRTERFVAVKIIHHDLARNPEGLERFRREAQLISKLEHPHLLPVYDYSADHDPQYIVMRYLEGGSLKDIIETRIRLPLGEIAHLMRHVCAALEYAHRKNIIHRDIKPGNIMVDQDGNAYLTDFGIARVISAPGFTQTGFAVGTPGYMSPEQGYGLDTIDQRADIYALGVMVFEMAVGNAPYTAPTPMGVLLKHLHDPIPSAHEQAPDLPAGIDDIIRRAMAKQPEDRYDSAKELADALVGLAGSTALTDTPVQLKAAATSALRRIEQRRDDDAIQTILAKFERERVNLAPMPDTPTTPMPASSQQAPTPVINTGVEVDNPPALSVTTDSPQRFWTQRRGLMGASGVILVVLLLLAVPAFFPPPSAPTTTPTENSTSIAAPDAPQGAVSTGDKIAFASDKDGNYEIYVMSADGSNLVRLTYDPGDDTFPAWSPDGTRLAFVSHRDNKSEIYVINADGTHPVNLTQNPDYSEFDPAWSPDGMHIAFVSDRDGNDEIYVMNVDGSGPVNLTHDPSMDYNPAWSPDSTRLVFTSSRDGDYRIYVMNADGSHLSQLSSDIGNNMAWSPDGTRIAYLSHRTDDAGRISDDAGIYVMNADGSHLVRVGSGENPDWSPDSTRIVFDALTMTADMDSSFEIYVMNADGSDQVRLTNKIDGYAPAWQPVPK